MNLKNLKNGLSEVKSIFVPKMLSSEFRRKKNTAEILISESRDDADYYVMLIIATLIITFGLTENNTAVIIGGMLTAPVLFPILALGLGAASGKSGLFLRSLRVLVASTLLILMISFGVASLFDAETYVNHEVELRLSYSWLSIGVAFFAGFAGAYAWARALKANLLGVAIAVALLPPLCVTGIQLAHRNMEEVDRSFTLFGINVAGIFVASLLVFLFFNYREVEGVMEKTVQEEAKENEE